MNLDELKIQLNQLNEINVGPTKSLEELKLILHSKSFSIAEKIKKSLIFEIVFSVVFFIAFSFIYFYVPVKGISIYFGSFALLCIPFIWVLLYLLKKVNLYRSSSLDVKANLTKLHNLIREFCKRYFQFTMALIPIAFFFSIYLSPEIINLSQNNQSSQSSSIPKSVYYGFLVGYLIGVAFGAYKFTKWYLKKLYGNYLNELELLINEL
jgi:hypothetical protein